MIQNYAAAKLGPQEEFILLAFVPNIFEFSSSLVISALIEDCQFLQDYFVIGFLLLAIFLNTIL